MSDEGFHEIQLNGKQLVFLFMAAAVVAVVVFLSGVMVGRGVRTDAVSAESGSQTTLAPEPAAGPAAAAGGGTAKPQEATAAAPPVGDDLGYYKALAEPPAVVPEAAKPAAAGEKPGAGQAGTSPGVGAQPPSEPGSGSTAKSAAPPVKAAPSKAAPTAGGVGFTVQVVALRERAASEAIAKRLAGKGYNAYVLEPPAGSAAGLFRVRVGPFKTRREAEEVRRRLEKEEQFKPSITR